MKLFIGNIKSFIYFLIMGDILECCSERNECDESLKTYIYEGSSIKQKKEQNEEQTYGKKVKNRHDQAVPSIRAKQSTTGMTEFLSKRIVSTDERNIKRAEATPKFLRNQEVQKLSKNGNKFKSQYTISEDEEYEPSTK